KNLPPPDHESRAAGGHAARAMQQPNASSAACRAAYAQSPEAPAVEGGPIRSPPAVAAYLSFETARRPQQPDSRGPVLKVRYTPRPVKGVLPPAGRTGRQAPPTLTAAG